MDTAQNEQLVEAAGLTTLSLSRRLLVRRLPLQPSEQLLHGVPTPLPNLLNSSRQSTEPASSRSTTARAVLKKPPPNWLICRDRRPTPPRSAPASNGTTAPVSGRTSTGARSATGPACAAPRRWPRTMGSISCASITPPRSPTSNTGKSETKNMEAGRSITTGPPAPAESAPAPSTTRPLTPHLRRRLRALAAEIFAADAGLPSISIGIDSERSRPASATTIWTKNVLTDGAAIGFVPNFISDHSYMQNPGSRKRFLCSNDTVTDSASAIDWTTRYADYQSMLQSTWEARRRSVQIMATEFNSVDCRPGQRDTSLVNGLFIAESIGSLLDSGYSGANVVGPAQRLRHDREQQQPSVRLARRAATTAYSARRQRSSKLPGTRTRRIPTISPSNWPPKSCKAAARSCPPARTIEDVDAYAVLEANGHLDLLVINTNPVASLSEQFNLTGFPPRGQATVWQYGETQDTAQSQSSTGASALANFTATLSLSGAIFPIHSRPIP